MKECPLCGEAMRLIVRDAVVHLPGTAETTTHVQREWVCPDCDYFEEAERGEG